MNCNSWKIAIVGGGGMVGSAVAMSLVNSLQNAEIYLIDIIDAAAEGQQMDIEDATYFSNCLIKKGDYHDAEDADLIIVTSGVPQRPGESRFELLGRNKAIIESIFKSIEKVKSSAYILVVGNPVDYITYFAYKYSKLPQNRVFGSGTFLDTIRLRLHLSKLTNIRSRDLKVNVIGEHGDNQVCSWSKGMVGPRPLLSIPEIKNLNLDEVNKLVASKAYQIIDKKKATYYGIGAAVAYIVGCLFSTEKSIIPLTIYDEKNDLYYSDLASLNYKNGVEPFEYTLEDKSEIQKVEQIKKTIKETLKSFF